MRRARASSSRSCSSRRLQADERSARSRSTSRRRTQQMGKLRATTEAFVAKNGRCPTAGEVARVADPWGRPYIIVCPGQKGHVADVVSQAAPTATSARPTTSAPGTEPASRDNRRARARRCLWPTRTALAVRRRRARMHDRQRLRHHRFLRRVHLRARHHRPRSARARAEPSPLGGASFLSCRRGNRLQRGARLPRPRRGRDAVYLDEPRAATATSSVTATSGLRQATRRRSIARRWGCVVSSILSVLADCALRPMRRAHADTGPKNSQCLIRRALAAWPPANYRNKRWLSLKHSSQKDRLSEPLYPNTGRVG